MFLFYSCRLRFLVWFEFVVFWVGFFRSVLYIRRYTSIILILLICGFSVRRVGVGFEVRYF